MSKSQIVLIAVVILIAFIVVISFVFLSFRPAASPTPGASANPSILPTQVVIDKENVGLHPDDKGVYQTISSSAAEMIDRDKKVGLLVKKLPYRTKNFSLTYDIDINSFIVELSPTQKVQANRDLDQFLQENGIMDRNWLYNITIKQQTY